MSCGQPIAVRRVEGPAGAPYQQPVHPALSPYAIYAPKKQNKWLWPTVLAMLVLLALLIGLMANLRTVAKGSASPLSAVAKGSAPPLTTGLVTMPQDVHDWLDHLRQTEDMKNKLESQQNSQLMIEFSKLNNLGGVYGMVDKNGTLDPDSLNSPSDSIGTTVKDMKAPWADVILFFESVPPPAECQNLAHTYDQALDEVRGAMGDIGDILDTSSTDPNGMVQKLTKLQGQSSDTIDRSFKQSDQMVSEICDKYNTRKWFVIKTDVGTPMSASGGGLLPSVPQN
jgi:hypothetical protein